MLHWDNCWSRSRVQKLVMSNPGWSENRATRLSLLTHQSIYVQFLFTALPWLAPLPPGLPPSCPSQYYELQALYTPTLPMQDLPGLPTPSSKLIATDTCSCLCRLPPSSLFEPVVTKGSLSNSTLFFSKWSFLYTL